MSPPGRAAAGPWEGPADGKNIGLDVPPHDTPPGHPIEKHAPPCWVTGVVTEKQIEELSNRSLWARLICQSSLVPTRRHVALTILQFANKNGTAWPNLETLSESTGLNEKTVRRCLDELADLGWLTVDRPNRRRSRTLSLCWPQSGHGVRTGVRTIEPSVDPVSVSVDTVSPESGHDARTEGTSVGNPEGFPTLVLLFESKLTDDGLIKNGREVEDKLDDLLSKYGEEGTRRRLEAVTVQKFWPSQVVKAATAATPRSPDLAYEFGWERGEWVAKGTFAEDYALEDIRHKYGSDPALLAEATQGLRERIAQDAQEAAA